MSCPNKSWIAEKIYFYTAVRRESVDLTTVFIFQENLKGKNKIITKIVLIPTKQIEWMVWMSYCKNFEIFSKFYLSYSKPLVSPNPYKIKLSYF